MALTSHYQCCRPLWQPLPRNNTMCAESHGAAACTNIQDTRWARFYRIKWRDIGERDGKVLTRLTFSSSLPQSFSVILKISALRPPTVIGYVIKTVFLVSTRNTGTGTMRKWPAQVSTVAANVGRELSLLKMVINMANADYPSFFLWNELEPRCQQRAAGSLELRCRQTLPLDCLA